MSTSSSTAVSQGIFQSVKKKENTANITWKCVMCSPTTIERQISNKGKVFQNLTQAQIGLQCDVCSQHACHTCLEKILSLVPVGFAATDPWCSYVRAFLNSSSSNFQQEHGYFTGHCCELREAGKFQKKKSEVKKDGNMKLDGSLFLPEFNLLINSPIGDGGPIDVHGMGKDKFLPGEVHCVINPVLARQLFKHNITPDGSAASYSTMGKNENYSITISLPYKSSTVTVSS
jgi:hypothetical protein